MMYLLTMGWFLAHTSLAMTPCNQWRVLVSEICKSRALQEHVPPIIQSSSVTEPTHTEDRSTATTECIAQKATDRTLRKAKKQVPRYELPL